MYDANGRLTRAGAAQLISRGESVCIGGHVITSLANLPGEAFFAKGNPAAEEAAKARLRQQIADAQKQLEAMGSVPGTINRVNEVQVPAPQPEAAQEPARDMPENLEALTAVELKKLCSEFHVPGYGSLAKPAMIEALNAKRVVA